MSSPHPLPTSGTLGPLAPPSTLPPSRSAQLPSRSLHLSSSPTVSSFTHHHHHHYVSQSTQSTQPALDLQQSSSPDNREVPSHPHSCSLSNRSSDRVSVDDAAYCPNDQPALTPPSSQLLSHFASPQSHSQSPRSRSTSSSPTLIQRLMQSDTQQPQLPIFRPQRTQPHTDNQLDDKTEHLPPAFLRHSPNSQPHNGDESEPCNGSYFTLPQLSMPIAISYRPQQPITQPSPDSLLPLNPHLNARSSHHITSTTPKLNSHKIHPLPLANSQLPELYYDDRSQNNLPFDSPRSLDEDRQSYHPPSSPPPPNQPLSGQYPSLSHFPPSNAPSAQRGSFSGSFQQHKPLSGSTSHHSRSQFEQHTPVSFLSQQASSGHFTTHSPLQSGHQRHPDDQLHHQFPLPSSSPLNPLSSNHPNPLHDPILLSQSSSSSSSSLSPGFQEHHFHPPPSSNHASLTTTSAFQPRQYDHHLHHTLTQLDPDALHNDFFHTSGSNLSNSSSHSIPHSQNVPYSGTNPVAALHFANSETYSNSNNPFNSSHPSSLPLLASPLGSNSLSLSTTQDLNNSFTYHNPPTRHPGLASSFHPNQLHPANPPNLYTSQPSNTSSSLSRIHQQLNHQSLRSAVSTSARPIIKYLPPQPPPKPHPLLYNYQSTLKSLNRFNALRSLQSLSKFGSYSNGHYIFTQSRWQVCFNVIVPEDLHFDPATHKVVVILEKGWLSVTIESPTPILSPNQYREANEAADLKLYPKTVANNPNIHNSIPMTSTQPLFTTTSSYHEPEPSGYDHESATPSISHSHFTSGGGGSSKSIGSHNAINVLNLPPPQRQSSQPHPLPNSNIVHPHSAVASLSSQTHYSTISEQHEHQGSTSATSRSRTTDHRHSLISNQSTTQSIASASVSKHPHPHSQPKSSSKLKSPGSTVDSPLHGSSNSITLFSEQLYRHVSTHEPTVKSLANYWSQAKHTESQYATSSASRFPNKLIHIHQLPPNKRRSPPKPAPPPHTSSNGTDSAGSSSKTSNSVPSLKSVSTNNHSSSDTVDPATKAIWVIEVILYKLDREAVSPWWSRPFVKGDRCSLPESISTMTFTHASSHPFLKNSSRDPDLQRFWSTYLPPDFFQQYKILLEQQHGNMLNGHTGTSYSGYDNDGANNLSQNSHTSQLSSQTPHTNSTRHHNTTSHQPHHYIQSKRPSNTTTHMSLHPTPTHPPHGTHSTSSHASDIHPPPSRSNRQPSQQSGHSRHSLLSNGSTNRPIGHVSQQYQHFNHQQPQQQQQQQLQSQQRPGQQVNGLLSTSYPSHPSQPHPPQQQQQQQQQYKPLVVRTTGPHHDDYSAPQPLLSPHSQASLPPSHSNTNSNSLAHSTASVGAFSYHYQSGGINNNNNNTTTTNNRYTNWNGVNPLNNPHGATLPSSSRHSTQQQQQQQIHSTHPNILVGFQPPMPSQGYYTVPSQPRVSSAHVPPNNHSQQQHQPHQLVRHASQYDTHTQQRAPNTTPSIIASRHPPQPSTPQSTSSSRTPAHQHVPPTHQFPFPQSHHSTSRSSGPLSPIIHPSQQQQLQQAQQRQQQQQQQSHQQQRR